MTFEIKKWLDTNIVPLVDEKPVSIHSFLWRNPDARDNHEGKIIHVWLLAESDDLSNWPQHCAELLLEHGWTFDFLRDAELAQVNENQVQLFGGNGAPMFGPSHMVSCRLFKIIDGNHCILQCGSQLSSPGDCTATVKEFYSLLGDNPLEAVQKFSAKWGAA